MATLSIASAGTFLLIAATSALAATPSWLQSAKTIVRDAAGNTYVAGTVSTDVIPITNGAFQTKFNAAICGYNTYFGTSTPIPCAHGFAAKISADGSTVLYATYLEGSRSDSVLSAAVDAAGNLFIFGTTSSSDFPLTGSMAGLPPRSDVGYHFFVLQLSPDGARLAFNYAFDFPGIHDASNISGFVVAPDGKLVFAGTTDAAAFPATAGAYLQARPNVSVDGYVFAWDPATNTIAHATLVGASDQDQISALTLDAAGNVYVAGYTISKDFPTTPAAFYSPGISDARVNDFVASLDPSLSTLRFSAYFGGIYQPIPGAIAVDSAGSVYVAGTGSQDMPVSPGAFETSFSGSFLVKLNQQGARMYMTYLGDGIFGAARTLIPAQDGSVWVAGLNQYLGVITTPDALVSSVANPYTSPSYLKHISADGSQQLYGTYLPQFLALVAPGVTLLPSTTALFQVADFNPPQQFPKLPSITAIVNAASLSQPGFIAPGEIVSIFGISIGPVQAVSYQLNSAGRISSNLNGLQVLFDGIAAPILYASESQINVIVPFALTGDVSLDPGQISMPGQTATVEIRNPVTATVLTSFPQKVSSLPGIFQSGGTGIIWNQDGTLNTPANPAQQGSTISFYATGLDQDGLVKTDGAIATAASRGAAAVLFGQNFMFPYTVLTNSVYSQYAGDAPGQVNGLQQINMRLPVGVVYNTLYIKSEKGVSNAVSFSEK